MAFTFNPILINIRRTNMKKILYIDMDNVLVDFPSAFKKLPQETLDQYKDNRDDIDGIFSLMEPMPGAVEAFDKYSQGNMKPTSSQLLPWDNPSAWTDKLLWVKKHLGKSAL